MQCYSRLILFARLFIPLSSMSICKVRSMKTQRNWTKGLHVHLSQPNTTNWLSQNFHIRNLERVNKPNSSSDNQRDDVRYDEADEHIGCEVGGAREALGRDTPRRSGYGPGRVRLFLSIYRRIRRCEIAPATTPQKWGHRKRIKLLQGKS